MKKPSIPDTWGRERKYAVMTRTRAGAPPAAKSPVFFTFSTTSVVSSGSKEQTL